MQMKEIDLLYIEEVLKEISQLEKAVEKDLLFATACR